MGAPHVNLFASSAPVQGQKPPEALANQLAPTRHPILVLAEGLQRALLTVYANAETAIRISKFLVI